jgi:hypothetical protein
MAKQKSGWDVARTVLYATNPLLGLIVEATTHAVSETQTASQTGKIEKIRAEAERQEFALKMAENQARVAQEVAIARRIETAEEVEIEEFYDYSGEGHVGLKTDGETLGVGVGAAGKRVSRRVYRFKGNAEKKPEEVWQLQQELLTTGTGGLRGVSEA